MEFGANNLPEIELRYGNRIGGGGTKRKRLATTNYDEEPDEAQEPEQDLPAPTEQEPGQEPQTSAETACSGRPREDLGAEKLETPEQSQEQPKEVKVPEDSPKPLDKTTQSPWIQQPKIPGHNNPKSLDITIQNGSCDTPELSRFDSGN